MMACDRAMMPTPSPALYCLTPTAKSTNMERDDKLALTLSLMLFTVTAGWFRRRQKRNEIKEVTNPFIKRSRTIPDDATIGTRGYAALSPPIPYLKSFFKCLDDPCDPTSNPRGYIGLCVAENKLVTEMIAARFLQPGTAATAFSDSTVYYYNSFLGLSPARQAVAYFLAKRFLFPDVPNLTPEQALQHISFGHVALGSGCAALLNYIFFIIGEENDAVLIPAPYYAAFENDMNVIAGCVPCSIHMANPALGPTENELDIAYIQARSRGLRVKFVLLTNPNNPLGVIYKPDVIKSTIRWARKRNMHTVVDEIYALSTHKVDHEFQSVIRVLDNQLGDDVHMLWALSKDFGSSGLRIGTIYSQNETFLEALGNLNIFSGVSQPIQAMAAELLIDDTFVDAFLEEARQRLCHSYEICVLKLQEMVIPFVPAEAGIFVYIDLSSLLPEKTFEGEARLCSLITDYARVVLTPGESQRERTPGMFRLCYAWVSPQVLEIAMERLSKLVAKLRKIDFEDLNAESLSSVLY